MSESNELEQALLEHLGRKGYRPVKPRKIAKALGLDESQARDLKKLVKRLVVAGRLAYGEAHTVGLADTIHSNRIVGVFRRTSGGYGFVRPRGTVDREEGADIYIPAKSAGDAANGDVVSVQLSKSQRSAGRPNRQGRIVDVIERETHRFVGTYFEAAGGGYVNVDGGLFAQPILVGDAGAKDTQVDDKVVLEMVRFPSHVHQGEGVVVDVLGQRGDPGIDTLSIIHEFNLPGEFGDDVLEDAREQAEQFDESIAAGRTDLTEATVITIDPFDARDFDDAISLELVEPVGRKRKPHWLLGVHIADVSHFVRDNSALDREAKHRATSVYLPDQVIPMIPETISNNLASLQPDRVRYTKTVFIEFTPDGTRVSVEPHAAAIRSKRRFTYEEVDEFLEDREPWRKKLTPEVHALLGRMHELAMILRRRRFARGSLELALPEVKIDLDKEGRVAGAHLEEHTESHQIIEEFMLAANEAVADLLAEKELAFLRRVHAAPDPRKLRMLSDFVGDLGYKTKSLESRFELQDLLDRVKREPEEHAINYAVLRSMQKAVYSPEDEGHYALASECYCHFTSPIRRYPDLTVHRLLDRVLAGEAPTVHFGELVTLGEHCSEREQRAASAERELIKVKLLDYLSHRIGEEMDAVITSVQEYGLFAQGLELPAEGLIHVSSLQDDYYHYDRRTHSLSGFRGGQSYRLGDFVRVAVARVDVDGRELDFRLVRRLPGRPDETGEPQGQHDGRRGRHGKGGAARGAKGRPSKPRGGQQGKQQSPSAGQGAAGKKSGRKQSGGQRTTGKKSPGKKTTGKNTTGKKSAGQKTTGSARSKSKNNNKDAAKTKGPANKKSGKKPSAGTKKSRPHAGQPKKKTRSRRKS
ncbi:MAG: ribonuclease R [Planctomycetota bacterium]|mgnify:CR=1 FL=1|nr:MAG: ribonuclease R [Planctomycetota bacterium]REK39382.1 MAG: ribonuclease R [Planctomycetota bacterium]